MQGKIVRVTVRGAKIVVLNGAINKDRPYSG
jgi:hypothetical protein